MHGSTQPFPTSKGKREVLENIIWFIEKIVQHWSLYFKGKNNAVNKKKFVWKLIQFHFENSGTEIKWFKGTYSTFYLQNCFYLKL